MTTHKCNICGRKVHKPILGEPFRYCPYCSCAYKPGEYLADIFMGWDLGEVMKQAAPKLAIDLEIERCVTDYLAEIGPGYKEWGDNGDK